MNYQMDYFYGHEANQFTFFRIPKLLFSDERFIGLTSDAKILYGLMLDRSWLKSFVKVNFLTRILKKKEEEVDLSEILMIFRSQKNIWSLLKKKGGFLNFLRRKKNLLQKMNSLMLNLFQNLRDILQLVYLMRHEVQVQLGQQEILPGIWQCIITRHVLQICHLPALSG